MQENDEPWDFHRDFAVPDFQRNLHGSPIHGGSLGSLGLKMSYQLDPHQVITKDDSNHRSLRGWPFPWSAIFQPHAPWILRADIDSNGPGMSWTPICYGSIFWALQNLDSEDFKYYIVRLEHDQYLLLHRV
jgi:hypothetical protein